MSENTKRAATRNGSQDFMVIRQFFSFAAVGAVGTAAHYSTFIVGALVNYTLNYRLTFQSSKLHRDSMPKFFLVALFGLGFNTAIMAFVTEVWRLHYLLAQILATGGVLVWNFTVNRFWTFK